MSMSYYSLILISTNSSLLITKCSSNELEKTFIAIIAKYKVCPTLLLHKATDEQCLAFKETWHNNQELVNNTLRIMREEAEAGTSEYLNPLPKRNINTWKVISLFLFALGIISLGLSIIERYYPGLF
jgi:hypothetical protein